LPERSQQANLRQLGDRRLQEIVEGFADAFERGDVDAILALLAEDATFGMPPYPGWCRGRDAIADSWLMPGGPPPRLRYVATRANGQPALATYLLDREAGAFLPLALDVLTLRGDLIVDVTAFRTPAIFPRFHLPGELPAAAAAPTEGDDRDQGGPQGDHPGGRPGAREGVLDDADRLHGRAG
jgi:RNA polymerase sigma-70 factor (ECF subfamily)